MSTLPNKPSELIRLGLADLEACEDDENYRINMREWHKPCIDGDGKTKPYCAVCLAGSVIAKTLGTDMNQHKDPLHFGMPEYDPPPLGTPTKLLCLDMFRLGYVWDPLEQMGLLTYPLQAELPEIVTIPLYSEDPFGFHRSMSGLANMLERHGL